MNISQHRILMTQNAHVMSSAATFSTGGSDDDVKGVTVELPASLVKLWRAFACQPCCQAYRQEDEDVPIYVNVHEELSPGEYVPDAAGCVVERPEIELSPGTFYTGQWKQGVFHGHGSLRRADGAVYIGFFHHGKAHGRGRFEGRQHLRGRMA